MHLLTDYRHCDLCPRHCGVDRTKGETGFCGAGCTPHVAHYMLHAWEEPFLSGKNGSGAIFFSGCSLGCVYCQNRDILSPTCGEGYSGEALGELMLTLQRQGAHNIDLITAAHYAPHVVQGVAWAKAAGLSIPVIYNSSGYETVETIEMLRGSVDIYLPDFRYIRAQTAANYSNAPDYPQVARAAIAAMVAQTGAPVFDACGMMKKGTVVRLLLLPGHLIEAKRILKALYDDHGDRIYISLMSQYTPRPGLEKYPELTHMVSPYEYMSLVEYAQSLGIEQALVQEGSAASDSFIPAFLPEQKKDKGQ